MFGFLFKRARKQKAEEFINNTLTSDCSLISMPKREKIETDNQAVEEVLKYKQEYLSNLASNSIVLSCNLMSVELQNLKNAYNDLLANLNVLDNTGVSFEAMNGNFSNRCLDIMITRVKLDLYLSGVEDLEREVKLRLIALVEILDSLPVSNVKKEAICNEINNLRISQSVFMTQKIAIENEKNNCLKNIENLEFSSFGSDEEKQRDIQRLLEQLRSLMNAVNPDKLRELDAMDLDPILLIAKLEQFLELYVYTNQDKLDSLIEDILKIENDLRDRVHFTLDKRQRLVIAEDPEEVRNIRIYYLNALKEIEGYYKIFSRFGRNMVYKEKIQKLYSLKFLLLVLTLNFDKWNILDDITFIEYELYQDIILRILEGISRGTNIYVKRFSQENNISEKVLIEKIEKIFKNGGSEFDIWGILSSPVLLAFCLSFCYYNGFVDFFDMMRVPKSQYSDVNFYEEVFQWEEWLPLKSIFFVNDFNTKIDGTCTSIQSALFDFYKFILPQKEFDDFYIPIGLRKIDTSKLENGSSEQKFLGQLIELTRGGHKTYVPRVKRLIDGQIFDCDYVEAENWITSEDGKDMEMIIIENYQVALPICSSVVHHFARLYNPKFYGDTVQLVPDIGNFIIKDEYGNIVRHFTESELVFPRLEENKGVFLHSISFREMNFIEQELLKILGLRTDLNEVLKH